MVVRPAQRQPRLADAASNSSRSPAESSSASASCAREANWGLRRFPVSIPRMVRTDTPDRSARPSCVNPARNRSRRTTEPVSSATLIPLEGTRISLPLDGSAHRPQVAGP